MAQNVVKMDNLGAIQAFYTVREFAKKLHVHPNTIRRAIKRGKINALTLGDGKKAQYRIPYTEAERLTICHLEQIAEAILEKRMNQK
jgi:excisionase family DNA binding protein